MYIYYAASLADVLLEEKCDKAKKDETAVPALLHVLLQAQEYAFFWVLLFFRGKIWHIAIFNKNEYLVH